MLPTGVSFLWRGRNHSYAVSAVRLHGRYLKVNRSFLFALETHGALPRGHDVIGSLCQSVDLMPGLQDRIRYGDIDQGTSQGKSNTRFCRVLARIDGVSFICELNSPYRQPKMKRSMLLTRAPLVDVFGNNVIAS